MRIFWLFSLILLAGVCSVNAQVAAPGLDPTLFANPAVVPFSASSHIGIQVFDVEVAINFDSNGDGVNDTGIILSGDGVGGQVKLVGEDFSAVFGGGKTSLENGNTEIESSDASGLLAIRLGEQIAVGVGLDNSTETETDKATGVSSEDETDGVTGGIVLRPGEVFFIGGAVGKGTLSTSTDLDGFLDAEQRVKFDSQVIQAGVALYQRDQDSGYHLEVYREEASFDDLSINGTVTAIPVEVRINSEEETTGVVLELVYNNYLVGIQGKKSKRVETQDLFVLGSFAGSSETREEGTEITVTLGYVPLDGLAVLLTHNRAETTISGSPNTIEIESTAVSLGMQF